MKEKRLVRIAAMLVFCCALFGCGKENNTLNEPIKGSVFGIVIDLGTNDPVANATVRLKPGYHSGGLWIWNPSLDEQTWLTGYDGSYEFLDVEDGKYSLSVSKTGYDDLVDDFVIVVKNGGRIRRDVQIEKLPVVYTNDVTEIKSLGYLGWDEENWGATFNGYVASVGSPAYVERGFCYANDLHYLTYVKVPGNGTGDYSKTVTGLSASTLYLVMAYVKTSTGQLVYGQEMNFLTSGSK